MSYKKISLILILDCLQKKVIRPAYQSIKQSDVIFFVALTIYKK